MTVCMYRDIHTLQPYIIDFTQRGCHTLRPKSKFYICTSSGVSSFFWIYGGCYGNSASCRERTLYQLSGKIFKYIETHLNNQLNDKSTMVYK